MPTEISVGVAILIEEWPAARACKCPCGSQKLRIPLARLYN